MPAWLKDNEHESYISRFAQIVICLQLILMVDASYEWPVCDQGTYEVASLLQLVGVTHQLQHTTHVEVVLQLRMTCAVKSTWQSTYQPGILKHSGQLSCQHCW